MQAPPQTDHIPGTHCLCSRCSNQWRESKHYQKVAHPHHCHWVPKFLGFTRYYCKFIPKFIQIAWPLHELMSRKNKGKKRAAVTWDERCQYLCTTVPILAYANFIRPFRLHTDACGSSLGLSSIRPMMTRPMPSSPMLAGPWPRLRPITHPTNWIFWLLSGLWLRSSMSTSMGQISTFILATIPWCTSHCWVASLANYNFQLYYRAGKANVNADALLNVPWPICMSDASGTQH